MKTQTNTNKMRKLVFVTLASLTVITTACSKNNSGGGNAAPPPVVVTPPVCPIQPCVNGMVGGGQMLYGGTTTSAGYFQAQFQVMGSPSGTGPGSITGVVQINNYVCQIGQPNLNGPFTIQMTQQGQLNADVFTGTVNLVGPQGMIPAAIEVVPTRTQSTGLFSLWLCGTRNDLNF
ncbi:MAG TPA: hypothetical protein VIG33_01720 [Pseudobdellovibrionaceae bacterium]